MLYSLSYLGKIFDMPNLAKFIAWHYSVDENFHFVVQGLSNLSVRCFLKSIKLERLLELFEREEVRMMS